MDTSKFLSKVIGLYLIIVSTAMIADMPAFYRHTHSLLTNIPLIFVSGFFTLILALLMIVSHNIWECSWRVIITIAGWLVLFKALNLILFPEYVDQATTLMLYDKSIAYGLAGTDLVLGFVLVYLGFKRVKPSE